MNRFAILTCGSSLLESWNEKKRLDYDLVFAVNLAGKHFSHDWLCFIDEYIESNLDSFIPPDIGYMTIPERRTSDQCDRKELTLYRSPVDVLGRYKTSYCMSCGFTFPCAIWEARKLDPNAKIDLFGADFNGSGLSEAEYPSIRWRQEKPWVHYALNAVTNGLTVDLIFRAIDMFSSMPDRLI